MTPSERTFRVCLVNPPVIAVIEPWYDTPPFGRTALAYLAGYLRQFDGFEVSIIDAKFERLSFDATMARIAELKPDVVGLTAFTNEIKPAAFLAHLVKMELPECITVVGGPHVTAIPQETLAEFPSFDMGVVGEGEVTFHELCTALRSRTELEPVKGIAYRKHGTIMQTAPRERILDQDCIPFPAWDLLPRASTYFIQSVRGCPFNCLFCMNPSGRVARKRSVANVMKELQWVIDEFSPERISFGDELFSVDMQRTALLLDAMADSDIGHRVRWDVQTHVQFVDRPLFRKFKRAGVERVELGVETGDEQSLKGMGKGTTLKMIHCACKAAKDEGVTIGTFFLFGQPNETPESLEKTVDLAVKLNPNLPMFGLMTPYPGTEVASMAAKGEGGYRLLTTDWDQYNKQIGGAMAFAGLSRAQIEWFQVMAYLKVYIYNHRFRDLAAFLWEYRKAGMEVMKKIVFRRNTLTGAQQRPVGYDAFFAGSAAPDMKVMEASRTNWNRTQQRELKRAKELAPELFTSIRTHAEVR
ncbi:MAG: B12-binding domain-containing radical SAM protein [Flavobacteriales bacterium]|nr:B12-binding domain-containing radical SAM protein [Flavobacteriales bacterium]